MQILRQFACHRGAEADVQWLDGKLAEYESRIQTLCWDGDRFIRGYTETGERIGAAGDPEANFWLNPQSWPSSAAWPPTASGRPSWTGSASG